MLFFPLTYYNKIYIYTIFNFCFSFFSIVFVCVFRYIDINIENSIKFNYSICVVKPMRMRNCTTTTTTTTNTTTCTAAPATVATAAAAATAATAAAAAATLLPQVKEYQNARIPRYTYISDKR